MINQISQKTIWFTLSHIKYIPEKSPSPNENLNVAKKHYNKKPDGRNAKYSEPGDTQGLPPKSGS